MASLTITVIFKIGTDPNTDLLLTQNRVQDTLSRLPQEVQLQGVQVKKTIQALLLGVHRVFAGRIAQRRNISRTTCLKIRDEIARLPGVADFQLFGERNTPCGSGSIRTRPPQSISAQTIS